MTTGAGVDGLLSPVAGVGVAALSGVVVGKVVS
jgi:hypothetical protein